MDITITIFEQVHPVSCRGPQRYNINTSRDKSGSSFSCSPTNLYLRILSEGNYNQVVCSTQLEEIAI